MGKGTSRVKKVPKPDHKWGYSDKLIRKILTPEEYIKFCAWMTGQTVAWDEKLGGITYKWDLDRFLDCIRKGIPTYWD